MRKNGNFLTDTLSVQSLLSPFKILFIIIFIVGFLFVSSVIAQTWFHQPDLLKQELLYTEAVFADSGGNQTDFHILIIRYCYNGLYWLFFELTGITAMFADGPDNLVQEFVVDILYPYKNHIEILNQTLKIISIRLGNLFAYMPLLACLLVAAVYDGFMKRKIRQQNAARESAGIYHRAKYWRTRWVWSSILLYMCLPFALPPILLGIPITLICVMFFVQAKYLKKYL